jgi:hypothetical protein
MTDDTRDRRQDSTHDSESATTDATAGDTRMIEAPLMPKPTFSTFILSLASSGLVHLGEAPDPATGRHSENISMAKHSIDILSMLQDKINNGLDKDEIRLLEGLLYELRMKYLIKK